MSDSIKDTEARIAAMAAERDVLQKQVAHLMDYKVVAIDRLNLVRCKGGRIKTRGIRCPHCDSYDDECRAMPKED